MSRTDPEPRCNHTLRFVHRVTNYPDSIGSAQITAENLPYKSVWVCERRSCVLDAMAWVERVKDESKGARAVVYDTAKGEVRI